MMKPFDATRLRNGPRRRGFSLVEAAISTLIVGGMLVVALDALGGAVRGRQLRADTGSAYTLAMDLMSEVMANAYEEPGDTVALSTAGGGGAVLVPLGLGVLPQGGLGPESDETVGGARLRFDDVDDYNGWSASPPQTRAGTVLAAYDVWTREASVSFANTLTLHQSASDTRIKRIVVTVTDPAGRKTTLTALRSKAGAFDYAPHTTTTYVSHLSVSLRPSGGNQTIVTGAADLNQIPYTGP